MTAVRWSPADLKQQRLVVQRIALRSELNRRELVLERRRLFARLRGLVGSPLVIGGCLVAGFLLTRPAARRRGATTVARVTRRARNVAGSVVWLTQIYRQFMSGVAAGVAFRERRRAKADGPYGDPSRRTR